MFGRIVALQFMFGFLIAREDNCQHNGFVCSCRRSCAFFRDCCGRATKVGSGQKTYDCVHPLPALRTQHNFTVYLVTRCPTGWKDAEVRDHCEKKGITDGVIFLIPVYSATGVLFRNRFCAECHGIKEFTTSPARLRDCGLPLLKTVDRDIVRNLLIQGSCKLQLSVPSTALHPCFPNEYDSCPDKQITQAANGCLNQPAKRVQCRGGVFRNIQCWHCSSFFDKQCRLVIPDPPIASHAASSEQSRNPSNTSLTIATVIKAELAALSICKTCDNSHNPYHNISTAILSAAFVLALLIVIAFYSNRLNLNC